MNAILLIAVVLATFISVYFLKPKDQSRVKLLLAFSGAFLLALTFFELIPPVYTLGDRRTNTLFILLGILLQIFLEFFSKGAEHGHMHWELSKNEFPVVLFISLSLHALIEGMPIAEHGNLIYGILIHKIPVAFVLSFFLLNSRLSMFLSCLFIVLFSLMTPLGNYLVALEAFSAYKVQLTALAVGVLLHISTIILFESAKGHSFDLKKLFVIILGFGIAYFL